MVGNRATGNSDRRRAGADGQPDTRTRLLMAMIDLVRMKGYAAARVEDVCEMAGVTKGGFFHHFKSKEDIAVQAADIWRANAEELFRTAQYQERATALERLLGYVDMRKALLTGDVYEYVCYAGTALQDTYQTHPEIAAGCSRAIFEHVDALLPDIEAAAREAGVDLPDPRGLASYMQVVVQGVLTMAKAEGGNETALKGLDHLRAYLEMLFGPAGKPAAAIQ